MLYNSKKGNEVEVKGDEDDKHRKESRMVRSPFELPHPTKNGGDDDCSELFQCSICLDLLYKPVVLACGHICCFWCVKKSMNNNRESNCALCRQPYQYFPSICWLLHNLLLKIEPVTYKRRQEEVLEQERKRDFFSLQLSELTPGVKGDKIRNKVIDASDVLCAGCRKILFRPAVLNCGHVYCESCIPRQMNKTIKCQICKSLHPGDIPKVSLDLDHFLKKHFPLQYDQRKETFQLKTVQFKDRGQSYGILSHEKEIGRSKRFLRLREGRMCIEENLSNVHIGIGCDICGMYPIIGKRYKCKDCKERIGFDMCRSCYRNPLKYPGRFNQQHTQDHVLLPDDSHKLANILRLEDENPEKLVDLDSEF